MVNWKEIKIVYLKEIQEIFRNKRVLITAFVIPVLIFPLIFAGMNWLQSFEKKQTREEGFKIAVTDDMDEITTFLRTESDVPVNIIYSDQIPRDVVDETVQLGLQFEDNAKSQRKIWMYFIGSKNKSINAMSHVEKLFSSHNYSWSRQFVARDLSNPAIESIDAMEIQLRDVASVEQQSGHRVGKILPLILIMMLVSGCSFAAVDMIAGEKERGCFETILVSRISRESVIIGKMFVVIITGIIALILNLLSVFIWVESGLLKSPDSTTMDFTIGFGSIIGIFICLIPITLIIAAILILISAKAKSYQSGQTLLMPVTLLSMVPALAATMPGMQSDSYLVIIPIANVMVGMREMLEGSLKLWPMLVGNVVNFALAVVFIKSAITSLNREGQLVSGVDHDSYQLDSLRKDPVRTAFIGFAVVWLLFFFIFVPLQAKDLVSGLLLTLWGLILLSGIYMVKFQDLPLKETLSLKPTNWKVMCGTVIFQTGFLPLVLLLNDFVMRYLPIPSQFMEEFADAITPDLPVVGILLLMAVSPGICEEVLFRGAILGSLRRRWPAWKSVVFSSIMFGFLHFSIYRLFATTVLGGAMGWMVIQTGSIYPAMLAHFWNNAMATVILPELPMADINELYMLLGLPLVVLGVFLIRTGSNESKDSDQ